MTNHKPLPSLSLLQSRLRYDPETGLFSRIHVSRKSRIGTINPRGYLQIGFDYDNYLAHRLAWLFATGEDPREWTVDHVNRVRRDNRIANLRLADRGLQNYNRRLSSLNSSGVTGVRFHRKDKRWRAKGSVNGRDLHLGSFATFEEAVAARRQFEADHPLGFTTNR